MAISFLIPIKNKDSGKKHIFTDKKVCPLCGKTNIKKIDFEKVRHEKLIQVIDDTFCKRCSKKAIELIKKKLSLKENLELGLIDEINLSSLRHFGYINLNNRLTSKGIALNLRDKNLNEQCEELCFELVKKKAILKTTPEQEALSYCRGKGYEGAFCEGGAILLLLKSMCLNKLIELNELGRNDTYTRFFEALIKISEDKTDLILDEIKNIKESSIIKNFKRIYNHSFVREWYPGLDANIIQGIYNSLGRQKIINIFNVFKHRPYEYRKGWPDLTVYNKNNEILFVEVKTTDKLRESQILTMYDMQRATGEKFIVLRINNL